MAGREKSAKQAKVTEHTMQRRTTLHTALAVVAATTLAWGSSAPGAKRGPKIAVTDLAYAQRVSREYFVAGAYQHLAQMTPAIKGGSHSHGMYGGGGSYSGQPVGAGLEADQRHLRGQQYLQLHRAARAR